MSFLDECRKLVALESTPEHGTREVVRYLGGLCERAGLVVEYQDEMLNGAEQCNLIARPAHARREGELLLQTHLDTVHAGHFGQWTKTQSNPFNASIYDGVMYGLGTADVKLDFLCKLEAVRALGSRAWRRPFVLVGTYGAESGMAGAIKLLRRKLIHATHALIGEPTGMRLSTAGTGLAVVEIAIPFSDEERTYRREHDLQESTSSQSRMFAGKAAHSSAPDLGDNAIMKMLNYLAQLPEGIAVMDLNGGINHNTVPAHALLEIDTVAGFRDPILPKISRIHSELRDLQSELSAYHDPHVLPASPTMNLGMVRTNEADVRILGSCRLPPSVTDAVYEGWMKRLSSAVSSVGATFRVREYTRGFMTPEGDFARGTREVLKAMNLDGNAHRLAVTSEANVFSRLGVECLVWGPGAGVGNSHAPNEHIALADLKTATEFYKHVIERFCV